MRYYVLPYYIATLDIECLSLDLRPVVDEFTVIITRLLPYDAPCPLNFTVAGHHNYSMDWWKTESNGGSEKMPIASSIYHPNLDIQFLNGHTCSDETLKFRQRVFDKNKINHNFLKRAALESRWHIQQIADSIRMDFQHYDVQEVWINHPEFDAPRLEAMFKLEENCWPIWKDFHMVENIGTVKRLHRAIGSSQDPFKAVELGPIGELRGGTTMHHAVMRHSSFGDCCYNLWVLGQARYLYAQRSRNELVEDGLNVQYTGDTVTVEKT